jgi:hypothetical protein
MLAPIVLFTYNRLSETQRTVEALQNNYLAHTSDLFIFSDGPKNESSASKVDEVREYIHKISGFKSITIFESPINKGVANSIISGVTQIIEQFGKIIVLEDDLVTSPNFLNFLNQGLKFYENHPEIFSIDGYSFNLSKLNYYSKDYYLGFRASSIGWGSWLDRWSPIDWSVKGYNKFKWDIFRQINFMRGGIDLPRMLRSQMNGKIDSWAIRWCFHQFSSNMVSVIPAKSKVSHIGMGPEATHVKGTKLYDTPLDNGIQTIFVFDENPKIDKRLVREFRLKFSILSRLKDKFLKLSWEGK